MKTLSDRVRAASTQSVFEETLNYFGIKIYAFWEKWEPLARGDFNNLPVSFQRAILAGEKANHASSSSK